MSVSPHIEVPFGMEKQDIVGDHVERVRTSVLVRHTAATIANWITRNTFYAGTPYSFHAHEYQEKILSDTSRDVSIRKCSQVGLSECSARNALGLVNVLSPYTVCYTLPTAKFAATFMKTRVDPVINASKVMRGNLNADNDNNEVKQFGDSWLYMRGAASSNAPISIPVDHLIHDEVDFSDQEVLGQYHSRLTHSPWKRSTRLSTPTLPKFGIDLSFQESRRHFNLCKCNHCNHFFIPDYYEHVRIPGFKEDLRTIRKQTLPRIRWEEAFVACPKCGKSPSLLPEHRHWVCENPTEKYIGAGYQVTPFDAPLIIMPSSLVEASTKYDRIQDFVNFNQGLPMEDSEATMSREDFLGVFVVGEAPSIGQMVMSADLGNLCHMAVGKVMTNDDILVVHTEIVPIGRFKDRYRALRKRVASGLHGDRLGAERRDHHVAADRRSVAVRVGLHALEVAGDARGRRKGRRVEEGRLVPAPGQRQPQPRLRCVHGVRARRSPSGARLGRQGADHHAPHVDEAREGLRPRIG